MKKSNRTPMKAKMQFWDGFGRKTHLSQKYNINITPYSSSSSSSSTSIKNKDRGKRTAPFVPPCLSDISQYCRERKNAVDAQTFLDHYTSNGWMVGKNKMKDWRAAVRTWEKRQFEPPQKLNNNYTGAILQDSHILCPRCKKEILRADLEGEGCLHCDGKEIT